MQKIMFEHLRFGLEQAVIARLKEMTRRRVRFPKGIDDKDATRQNLHNIMAHLEEYAAKKVELRKQTETTN